MLPSNQQHLVINASIFVDEKVNKIGHEYLIIAEGSRKGGDAGGIPSLRSYSGRVIRHVEALSYPKLNSGCAHKVGCLLDIAASPRNYRTHNFYVTGERGYDAEELPNLTEICEHLTRRLNGRENYHSHLTTVVLGEEGEEFRVVIHL